MIELLIIADDFTGALDTGVQFTKKGIKTLVTTNDEIKMDKIDSDVQVLVVDVESRHVSSKIAYDRVKKVAKAAKQCNVPHIYKKTDSALRGNIGGELQAVLDAYEETELFFLPAFPKIGRTTKEGYHYLDGVPINESVFGQDPFEPVKYSYIPQIIKEQSDVQVETVPVGSNQTFDTATGKQVIYVFDAVTGEDLRANGELVKKNGKLKVLAGCAGFAEFLPDLLEIKTKPQDVIVNDIGMIVVSGSVNQITLDQLNYAKESGFFSYTFLPQQKLDKNYTASSQCEEFMDYIEEQYRSSRRIVLEAVSNREQMKLADEYAKENGINFDDMRHIIADNIGKMVAELMKRNEQTTLVVFGGDTLIAIIEHMECQGIVPITEVTPGVVLARAVGSQHSFNIVTKSGGFGEKDVIEKIEKFLKV
jgi:uncharacterized protein YgbK (DUF1537 family)